METELPSPEPEEHMWPIAAKASIPIDRPALEGTPVTLSPGRRTKSSPEQDSQSG